MTDVTLTLPEPGPNPHVIAENALFVPADPYEIVVFRLDVGPEAIRASAALLSDAERQRASRFAFDRDRRGRPLGFFNCWTRKEAFIKAIGDGLYHPLDCFDVSLAPAEPAKILRVEGKSGDHCGWCLDSFFPAPGFVAAVVTESRKRHVEFAALLPCLARPATMP